MYYSFLYQGIFGIAFLNFLVFWTDLFFSTTNKPYLFGFRPLARIEPKRQAPKKNGSVDAQPSKIISGPKSIILASVNHPFEILEFLTSTVLWFLLTLLLCFRYLKANHFPLANFYEALIFLTWCLVTLNFFLVFGTKVPLPSNFSKKANRNSNPKTSPGAKSPILFFKSIYNQCLYGVRLVSKRESQSQVIETRHEGLNPPGSNLRIAPLKNSDVRPQNKIYGGILAPCILFIIAFAQFNLSSEFSPLVPALKSNWLLMHVSIMIFSYTIFIVAGLISLILIIQKYYRSFEFFLRSQKILAFVDNSPRPQKFPIFGPACKIVDERDGIFSPKFKDLGENFLGLHKRNLTKNTSENNLSPIRFPS